jgi:hypothetical protein
MTKEPQIVGTESLSTMSARATSHKEPAFVDSVRG